MDIEAKAPSNFGVDERIYKLELFANCSEDEKMLAEVHNQILDYEVGKPPKGVTFTDFSVANAARCEISWHAVNEWQPERWALAIAGETGELCNLIKKKIRGDKIDDADILKEIADIVTYCDLLCTRMNADLGAVVIAKFNEVSDRVGSDIKL